MGRGKGGVRVGGRVRVRLRLLAHAWSCSSKGDMWEI